MVVVVTALERRAALIALMEASEPVEGSGHGPFEGPSDSDWARICVPGREPWLTSEELKRELALAYVAHRMLAHREELPGDAVRLPRVVRRRPA